MVFFSLGGFSYVYLVKELSDAASGQSLNNTVHGGEGRSGSFGNGSSNNVGSRRSIGNDKGGGGERREMVLKVTSILSRQQRDIAEKEAKLLSRLSHPSIIKMYDTCYRTVTASSGGGRRGKNKEPEKERPQHLILMEFCEGGHALDVCTNYVARGERFDLSTLIIAFGQICNAVSYLHAQRPPIVHRDLKPANFLIKNNNYKLCDFGSAVFGHVDLKTQKARVEAEEVIEKTTTQMFRAPEMVDLYMAKKLTQATDVWALGCCLYSLAFLQNCFEEGSNLAILSRKYKIPDDNPYGEGLVDLIDRMLTIDSKERANMTEVILCLSAIYSGKPLPPRKERTKSRKEGEGSSHGRDGSDKEQAASSSSAKNERAGKFRTDSQGMYGQNLEIDPTEIAKKAPAKKLNPNSAAARRRAAAGDMEFATFHSKFDEQAAQQAKVDNPDAAFTADTSAFAAFGGEQQQGSGSKSDGLDLLASFDDHDGGGAEDVMDAFSQNQQWGSGDGADAFASFSQESVDPPGQEAGKSKDSKESKEDKEQRRRRKSGSNRTRTTGSGDSSDHHRSRDRGDDKASAPMKVRSGRRMGLATGPSMEGGELAEMSEAVSGAGDDEAKHQSRRSSGGHRSSSSGSGGKVRRTKSSAGSGRRSSNKRE